MLVTTNWPPAPGLQLATCIITKSMVSRHIWPNKSVSPLSHFSRKRLLPLLFVASFLFLQKSLSSTSAKTTTCLVSMFTFWKNLWRCNISKFQFVFVSPSVSSVSNVFYPMLGRLFLTKLAFLWGKLWKNWNCAVIFCHGRVLKGEITSPIYLSPTQAVQGDNPIVKK